MAVDNINADVELVPDKGKSTVLVTGGAGFIGSHATLALFERGYAVVVVDNLSRGNYGALKTLERLAPPKKFKFVLADLADKNAVAGILTNNKVSLVMHFAAVAYVGESVAKPLMYYGLITSNTVTLLEAMEEAGVKQLVYSSTCAVYGNPEKLPVTEETVPDPINPYGESKLMAEKIIKRYAFANSDFKAVILRYFNVYGSDPAGRLGEFPRPEFRSMGRISGAVLDAALGLIPHVTILGTTHPTPDGSCIRDYIHVCDLVDAHIVAMNNLSNPIEIYNIATGKGISVKEFVYACKKVTALDFKVVEQEEPRPGDYAIIFADPAKIESAFSWKARYVDVEESFQHAWSWRKEHPNGYEL